MFSTDAASDAITHFIGLFHLTELQARLRLEYVEFDARAADVETGAIAALSADVRHPYAPRDYIPEIRYVPPDYPPGTVANGAPLEMVPLRIVPFGAQLPEPAPVTRLAPGLDDVDADVPPAPGVHLYLAPPPSAVVIVVQHNALVDNDTLNAHRFQGEVTQEALSLQLDAMAHQAAGLGIDPDLDLPATEAEFVTMAVKLGDAALPAVTQASDAEVFTATAADAMGTHLDGVAGAERPELDDVLPAGWTDVHQREDDDEGPTHEIVHGANTLLNEVVLTASWISAPVIAVAGASYAYDVISQVNLWQDIDSVIGVAESVWNGPGSGTEAFNFASLVHADRPFPVPAAGDGDAPAFWAVTTIEGSLINFNWIEQRNFVSDNDMTSITLMGNETMMVFGANQATNQVSLFELGARFDLIIVDGNLINLAAIMQTNVLLDSDHVMMRDGGALSTGDNLLLNDASILQVGQGNHVAAAGGFDALLDGGPDDLPADVLDDPAFAGADVLRVLHVKGDLVTAQIIEQLNILGDADQVDLLAARAMENAGDVSVTTGSNVLINAAVIAEFGVNSTIHTRGGAYSDALIHQAELVDTHNPFAGAGLASEAVVFLADGMADGPAADMGDAAFGGLPPADLPPIDPMQMVLA